MAKKMLEECAKKEGASSDDVNNAIAHQPPKTKPEKCLHACMGETLGLVRTLDSSGHTLDQTSKYTLLLPTQDSKWKDKC